MESLAHKNARLCPLPSVRAPPGLDASHTACKRQGWSLRLAPWRVRGQAQERENLFHRQGFDHRPGKAGYRDDGGVDTGW